MAVFGEFGQVLRPGGAAVIYQMAPTKWLTPAEAARLRPPLGSYPSSVDPQRFEAAIAAAGLSIGQCVQLGGESLEKNKKDRGRPHLPAAAACFAAAPRPPGPPAAVRR